MEVKVFQFKRILVLFVAKVATLSRFRLASHNYTFACTECTEWFRSRVLCVLCYDSECIEIKTYKDSFYTMPWSANGGLQIIIKLTARHALKMWL